MPKFMFSIYSGIRRRSLALWRDRGGVAAVIFAITLPALVAFTALAVDMSYAYWTRTQLQHTASAAALAGASQLNAPVDTENTVKTEAITYANLNMDPARFGTTLVVVDVVLGNWEPISREFTPMGTTGGNGAACDFPVPQETDPNCLAIDAVEATTRKAQANGNQLELFLGAVVGLAETDISTVAIAWGVGAGASEDDCYTRGIMANGVVDMDGNNTFTDKICVYGEEGVKIQSDNCFQGPGEGCGALPINPGVEIMTPGYWDEQGWDNDGFEEAKREGYQEVTLAEQVDAYIDAAEDGFPFASWSAPGFEYEVYADPNIAHGPQPSLPDVLQPYTIYEIDGTADVPEGDWDHVAIIADIIKVPSGTTLDHVILMAEDEIDVSSDFVIDHAVLASRGEMKFGSNGRLGGPPGTACDPISAAVFSLGKFTIQSDTTFRNAQLVTGYTLDTFDLQSDNTYEGVTMQALGDISLGSDNNLVGCSLSGGGTTGTSSGLYVRLVH